MFILAFLCLAALVWLVGLVLSPARRQINLYAGLSVSFVFVGLLLFTGLSMMVGLVRFGVAENLSIPGDYIEQGALGVLILAVGLTGVLSPGLAAWLVSTRKLEVGS